MQKIKILNRKDIKAVLNIIKKQWKVEIKLDYAFLLNNKDRLYIVSREVFDIDQNNIRIDTVGLYFGTLKNNELRLSIEGAQIVGPYAKRNIIDINDEDALSWVRGDDIKADSAYPGYIIIKHGNDFLGCGKARDGMLKNHYPKSRRISG